MADVAAPQNPVLHWDPGIEAARTSHEAHGKVCREPFQPPLGPRGFQLSHPVTGSRVGLGCTVGAHTSNTPFPPFPHPPVLCIWIEGIG